MELHLLIKYVSAKWEMLDIFVAFNMVIIYLTQCGIIHIINVCDWE